MVLKHVAETLEDELDVVEVSPYMERKPGEGVSLHIKIVDDISTLEGWDDLVEKVHEITRREEGDNVIFTEIEKLN